MVFYHGCAYAGRLLLCDERIHMLTGTLCALEGDRIFEDLLGNLTDVTGLWDKLATEEIELRV